MAVRSDHDQRVGPGQAIGHGLAQRTGRHDASIAQPEAAIECDQAEILGQVGILETIVHHQHIGARGDGGAGGGDPVGADPDRYMACDQQGFVADVAGAAALQIDP